MGTRWFNTVVNQPNAKAVVGQVNLCTKMAEFDAKKFAEFSGKGDNKKEKKEKAPKQEAKKQPEKKKEEKKEEKPAEDEPKIEKKADPFEKMPKGTFDLENGSDSTPTMMNQSQWPGSGNILTMRTTPSG